MHDILHLTNGHTQYNNRTTQLIQLKFNVSRLHGRDRQDKGSRIQNKGQRRADILGVRTQIMQMRIVLNDFADKVSVGIKDGHKEPHPLRGPKQRNGIVLNRIKMRIVSHLDEFAKEQNFGECHNHAHVDMSTVDARTKDPNHASAGHDADPQFVPPRLVLGDLGARH